MKKTIYFLLIVLSLTMVIPGQNKKVDAASNNMSQFLKYYKVKNYTEARKYFNQMEKYANESCVKKMSLKRKKAYQKIVKKYKKYGYDSNNYLDNYFYSDIDNKKDAELILVTGNTSWKKMIVYKYKKGKAVKVGDHKIYHQTLYAYPGHSGIVSIHGLDFGENVGVIYLSKGKIKYKAYGHRDLTKNDYFYGHGMLKGYIY